MTFRKCIHPNFHRHHNDKVFSISLHISLLMLIRFFVVFHCVKIVLCKPLGLIIIKNLFAICLKMFQSFFFLLSHVRMWGVMKTQGFFIMSTQPFIVNRIETNHGYIFTFYGLYVISWKVIRRKVILAKMLSCVFVCSTNELLNFVHKHIENQTQNYDGWDDHKKTHIIATIINAVRNFSTISDSTNQCRNRITWRKFFLSISKSQLTIKSLPETLEKLFQIR